MGQIRIKVKRTEVDNIWFDSRAEALYYRDYLKPRLLAGDISELKFHPSYRLVVNGKLVCTYRADFDFIENGTLVTVDVKGMETEKFKIKKKLFEAIYEREIRLERVYVKGNRLKWKAMKVAARKRRK